MEISILSWWMMFLLRAGCWLQERLESKFWPALSFSWAAIGFLRSSNAAVINFGTTILMPQSQEVRGIPINKGLYPSVLKQTSSGHYNHEYFWHRVHNVGDHELFALVVYSLDYLVPYWLQEPRNEHTSPTRFARHSDLLIASMSPMLEFTKPRSNDVIELDVDCPPRSQLPEKYQIFVDDPASKGTIVFAMGHMGDWDNAPEGTFDAFFHAFSRLTDYRIVWQYSSEKRKPKPPSHVLLDAWVPQAALLYHPKAKVFISHMGGKSLRETICAGVPVVTMPMFAEQYRNAAIAHKKNIATFLGKSGILWKVSLHFLCVLGKVALSPDTIYQAVTKVLNDSSYQKNAKTLQKQMDDQIMKPMDLGRFWCEFLLRHKLDSISRYFPMSYRKLSCLEQHSSEIFGLFLFVAASGMMWTIFWKTAFLNAKLALFYCTMLLKAPI